MKISRKLFFLVLAVGFALIFIIINIPILDIVYWDYIGACLRKPTLSCVQTSFIYGRYDRAWEQYAALELTEKKIEPLFDALNDSVYQSLPLPEGTREIEKPTIGLVWHRRPLIIKYAFFETSLNDVLSVYNQFLLGNDWELIYKIDDDQEVEYYFNKETACLNIFSTKSTAKYVIAIYYDYLKQDFSPVISPPLTEDFVIWADYDSISGRGFAKCPDQR